MTTCVLPHTPWADEPEFDELTDMYRDCACMHIRPAPGHKPEPPRLPAPGCYQDLALKYIQQNPGCTQAEITSILGLEKESVRGAVNGLIARRLIAAHELPRNVSAYYAT